MCQLYSGLVSAAGTEAKHMLIVTHFAVPFYSYYLTDRLRKKYKDKRELFLYSCIIGLAGLTPDIFRAHLTLSSRYNAFSHTAFFPLIALVISIIVVFFLRLPKRFILWIPLGVMTHLLLDAISGGIRLFPSGDIIGNNMIKLSSWGFFEIFFLSLLIITYRHDIRKKVKKAEDYN
jgi:hypothetical protein